MMKNRIALLCLAFCGLVLSACAETRFGEPVERGPRGELPAVEISRVTEREALLAYEQSELSAGTSIPKTRWEALRAELAGDSTAQRSRRQRIGHLLLIAKKDSTLVRTELVQLWAILYAAELDEAALTRAEKVLEEKVLLQTDLEVLVYLAWLHTLVSPVENPDEAQEEELGKMDRFFRTGEK